MSEGGVTGGSFSYGAAHPVQRAPVQGPAPYAIETSGWDVPADTRPREVRKGLIEIFKNNPDNDFSVRIPWKTTEGFKVLKDLNIQPERAGELRAAAELALKNHTQLNVWGGDGEIFGTIDPNDVLKALAKK